MTSLTERAEQADLEARPTAPPDRPASSELPALSEPLIDLDDYVAMDGDPDMIPVHLAWLRVRREIGVISKDQLYKAPGKNGRADTKYNFRGIDDVLNAFGPATLKHGVSIIPVKAVYQHRDMHGDTGSKARECTITVTWHVIGPMGDVLEMESCGESIDYGDHGTAKAFSVALRVLALTGGLIPVKGISGGDAVTIDRGEAPPRTPASYVTEIVNPETSVGRLRQIYDELKIIGALAALVRNENDEEEAIGIMVRRIGAARKALAETEREPS